MGGVPLQLALFIMKMLTCLLYWMPGKTFVQLIILSHTDMNSWVKLIISNYGETNTLHIITVLYAHIFFIYNEFGERAEMKRKREKLYLSLTSL